MASGGLDEERHVSSASGAWISPLRVGRAERPSRRAVSKRPARWNKIWRSFLPRRAVAASMCRSYTEEQPDDSELEKEEEEEKEKRKEDGETKKEAGAKAAAAAEKGGSALAAFHHAAHALAPRWLLLLLLRCAWRRLTKG